MSGKSKNFFKLIIPGALILAIGILIAGNTGSFIRILMVASGVCALANGLYTLIGISKWKYVNITRTFAEAKGVENTLIGFAAIIMGFLAADKAFTVMVYILATGIAFSALVSFQNAAVAKTFEIPYMRKHFLYEGIISLLIAVILFLEPIRVFSAIVGILGYVLIACGAVMVIFALIRVFSRKKEEIIEDVEETHD